LLKVSDLVSRVETFIAEPVLFKPKNMHQKTFNRLRNEAYRAGDEGWTIGIEDLDRRMNHLDEKLEALKNF
jgi:hypothetical protein